MTTPFGEAAASWLSDKTQAILDATATLVEVNSFTENVDGGRKTGALLRELLTIPGLACDVRPSEKYADHLVFRSNGRQDPARARPPVALVGHLDTVFPPGTFEGFRRDGDLVRGPGVLDMKGGLVIVAYALRALVEAGGLDRIAPLRLVIVADEEIGSPEGQGIIRDAIAGAGECLVFEAGRKADAIITRRKGTGAVQAMAHGVAAHAGNNHKEGKNALWAMSRFVDRVQALTDYDAGVTVNVGKVVGGQGKNTVPDRADAWLDVRFCTRADADATLAKMRAIAAQIAVELPGTRVELDGGVARLPLEKSDASTKLMNAYAACARASGLGDAEAPLIGGGSDASTSSAMGIASIDGLGPRGIGFHTKDEQVEVASIVPKAQALARFLALASP
jgi:glutamate carboxypeptidase